MTRAVTVARNVAGGNGGGVWLVGTPGELIVQDSTIRRNLAGSGGGIYATTATVTRSAISGNFAAGFGGGIRAVTALTLSSSTVSGNTAGSTGGGIFAATATLTNATVSNNSVLGGDGGGIRVNVANVTNSTLSGNSAEGNGGGLDADTATLTNTTVSGNLSRADGGGIRATTATLLNCTVVENIALNGGGLFDNPGGTFSVRNTIVALNLVDLTGFGPDVAGGPFTSLGHNLIGNTPVGSGFTNGVNGDIVGTAANPIDRKLGPLANNGWPTKTHALLAGSAAIDRGDNVGVPSTDQRGLPRVKDGNFNGVAIVDIGAYER
jgi:predicted outer membrane repeat protein